MSSAIVLFTRDLRVHDHPGLTAASEYDAIVPLFVFDDALLRDAGRPNRLRFLLDALTDLRESLRRRGADLIVRRGDVVEQTVVIARTAGAKTVFTGDAISAYAQRGHSSCRLSSTCGSSRTPPRLHHPPPLPRVA